jgi:hypothetical protein
MSRDAKLPQAIKNRYLDAVVARPVPPATKHSDGEGELSI